MKPFTFTALILCSLIGSGCVSSTNSATCSEATDCFALNLPIGVDANKKNCPDEPCPPKKDGDYIKAANCAINSLFCSKNIKKLGDRAIIYGTTLNLDKYRDTTDFGRLTSECLANAAARKTNNDLIKVTLRQANMPIRSTQGEFVLSRETADLARDFNAGAVLLSTYSSSPDTVYVQVQLVNADTHTIVGSAMYTLPNGPRTRALLDNRDTFISAAN